MSKNNNNIPELKILDDLLLQLENKTADEPMVFADILWYDNKLFDTSKRNRKTIIEKLIKDGYADHIEHAETKEHLYFITFDGLIFLKKGGYTTEFRNESLLNNRLKDINDLTLEKLKYDTVMSKRKLKTFWIMFLTALLGIGFSLYNFIVNIKEKPHTEDIRKEHIISPSLQKYTPTKDTTSHIFP